MLTACILPTMQGLPTASGGADEPISEPEKEPEVPLKKRRSSTRLGSTSGERVRRRSTSGSSRRRSVSAVLALGSLLLNHDFSSRISRRKTKLHSQLSLLPGRAHESEGLSEMSALEPLGVHRTRKACSIPFSNDFLLLLPCSCPTYVLVCVLLRSVAYHYFLSKRSKFPICLHVHGDFDHSSHGLLAPSQQPLQCIWESCSRYGRVSGNRQDGRLFHSQNNSQGLSCLDRNWLRDEWG
jgi:hypothetical protein